MQEREYAKRRGEIGSENEIEAVKLYVDEEGPYLSYMESWKFCTSFSTSSSHVVIQQEAMPSGREANM